MNVGDKLTVRSPAGVVQHAAVYALSGTRTDGWFRWNQSFASELSLAEEGCCWIYGQPPLDGPEVHAMQAAYALRYGAR